MKDEIKEILDNIKKYQFQLLTSTGLGHVYFYCYGDDRFENWLKRKNIKYKIVKSDLLDYITNLQELCNKYEEEHSTTFNYWKQLIKEDYKSRCEKAIEYIKDNLYYCVDNDDTNLLNILKGSDANE